MRWTHAVLISATLGAASAPAAAQRAEALQSRQMVEELRAMLVPLTSRMAPLGMDLQARQLRLQAMELSMAAPSLAAQALRLRGELDLEAMRARELAPMRARSIMSEPPAPWLADDPADSLYRLARLALTRGRYREAADAFRLLQVKYPKSGYAPDAMYWQAFALYREGGMERLHQAATVLDQQRSTYPDAATGGDAETLAVRVRGELARLGDNDAAAAIAASADAAAEAPRAEANAERAAAEAARSAARAGRVTGARAPRAARASRSECTGDDDSDIKLAALNGLLQMDAERAVPILRKVLARRDSSSVCLRRKAIFLVSQKQTEGTEDILLDAARTDPDPEVKQQAVFWLSQVGTDKAVTALDSIIRRSNDPALQDKAIFALAQHGGARATASLRAYAERTDVPEDMREKAVFWLGQNNSVENAAFLRTMYGRSQSTTLKQKILFSLSQAGGAENEKFLLDIVRSKTEPVDARKQALFWAGQSGSIGSAELGSLYGSMPDREMREQIIFVLSQRNDAAAMDKLIDIARKDPDPNMRKRALFWVGQSKDPRATQLLQDILDDK